MQSLENITIDRFHIQRLLIKGGMSEIYLAHDIDTQEAVAIKLVHSSNTNYCERFEREIGVVKLLQHDHILPALANGFYEGWCYLVTPYIEYGTLQKRMAQGTLTSDEAATLLLQIGNALQFAHDHDVIHRDLKPSNILLRDGEYPYLMDFGLARKLDEEDGLTSSNYLIGTPEYMAPELADQEASVSSDVYALGVILYQMLTGRVPFRGQTPVASFMKHIFEKPRRPSSLNRAISGPIEKVILRALEKNPYRRYRSVQGLVDAYINALEQEKSINHFKTADIATHLIPLPQVAQALPEVRYVALAKTPRGQTARLLVGAVLLLSFTLLLSFAVYRSNVDAQATNISRANVASMKPPITPTPIAISNLKGELHIKPKRPAPVLRPTQPPTQSYFSTSASDDDHDNNYYQGDDDGDSTPGYTHHHKHHHRD